MWITGNNPAHITAISVIASAERLTDVRHVWLNKNRIAEMNVPACPIPIQKTKFVMSKAQPIVLFKPQVPMPVVTVYVVAIAPAMSKQNETEKAIHHPTPGLLSSSLQMSVV